MFSDVGESLSGVQFYKRIDVLFDVCRDNSVKNAKREQ